MMPRAAGGAGALFIGGQQQQQQQQGQDGDQQALLDDTGFQDGQQGNVNPTNSGRPVVDPSSQKLGTFFGVFCPVSVSMFSTLLFLRPGFVMANLGLAGALMALLLSYALLALTVQSLSAIVTNGDVRGGGVYYMLSRCLGPEIGGTIGVVFYAANAVGSALYATGAAEGVTALGLNAEDTGLGDNNFRYLLSSICNLLSLVICLMGADMFSAVSLTVLAGIVFVFGDLVYNFCFSPTWVINTFNVTTVPHCRHNCTYQTVNGTFQSLYYLGADGISRNLENNFYSAAVYDCSDSAVHVTAKTAFAVLFSGVTGIMAGANLSGELKAPSKSIPVGTYCAGGFTFTVYTVLFFLTAATCSRDLLYHDCHYLTAVSAPSFMVSAAALITTFCAATSCMLGASQLIQAVAKDNLLPRFVSSPLKWGVFRGRPVLAYVLTFFIIQLVLTAHSLNQIAKLCTICYMLSYGFVNLACVLLDWSAAVNFRPVMGTHWSVALVAVALCVAAMAAVSLLYSLVGFFMTLVFGACVIFGTRHGEKKNWGSVQQGILYHQVRKYLLMLDTRKYHVKFWRPQILLLVSEPARAAQAITLANSLKKGGLFVLGHIFRGETASLREWNECPTVGAPRPWMDLVDRLGVKAFPDLTVATSLRAGVQQLARLSASEP